MWAPLQIGSQHWAPFPLFFGQNACQLPFDPPCNVVPFPPFFVRLWKVFLKGCLPLTRGIHDDMVAQWLSGWVVVALTLALDLVAPGLLLLPGQLVGKFLNILYMQSIRELVFSLIQLPIFYIECVCVGVWVCVWAACRSYLMAILQRGRKAHFCTTTQPPTYSSSPSDFLFFFWRRISFRFLNVVVVCVVIVTLRWKNVKKGG